MAKTLDIENVPKEINALKRKGASIIEIANYLIDSLFDYGELEKIAFDVFGFHLDSLTMEIEHNNSKTVKLGIVCGIDGFKDNPNEKEFCRFVIRKHCPDVVNFVEIHRGTVMVFENWTSEVTLTFSVMTQE